MCTALALGLLSLLQTDALARAVVQAAPVPIAPAQSAAFRLGGLTAEPGTVVRGQLDVPAGSDAGTFIPFTVVHGTRPGPVLALVAGIHGSETTPILALQRLADRLDGARLSGTVLLVHVANVPSFLGRTVYVSPRDGKNLNRQFPGRADGTVSERISHVLTTEIIARSDYVVDVHSGDANEDLRPWTGFYAQHGTSEVISASRAMAVAFGVDRIVEFPFAPSPQEPALYTGAQAVRAGKPSFDVEVGRLGLIEPAALELVARGLTSVMRHLRMLDGAPTRATSPWFITRRVNLSSEHDGLFYPQVRAGQVVLAGALIGRLTDFHGRLLQELRSAERAEVLVVVGTPPVSKGETLVVLAPRPAALPSRR